MRLLAVVLGAVGAFFTYYLVRLLIVTRLLQETRAGGGGAYIGAVVFPVLALGCAAAARWAWRRAAGAGRSR